MYLQPIPDLPNATVPLLLRSIAYAIACRTRLSLNSGCLSRLM